MATANWSSLNDGDIIAFAPLVDVLNFDNAAISAADLFFDSPSGGTPVVSFGRKTVTTTSVTFACGTPHGCLNEGNCL